MIRMLTPLVREIRRDRASTTGRDPILDPGAGVVHGDGRTPDHLQPTVHIQIINLPGPRTQPFIDAPKRQPKPRARRARARRRTRLFSPPLRGLFGPRSLR